jgi:hypothetical protein
MIDHRHNQLAPRSRPAFLDTPSTDLDLSLRTSCATKVKKDAFRDLTRPQQYDRRIPPDRLQKF